jgi:quercetin dioxygenase-like cupin family protein
MGVQSSERYRQLGAATSRLGLKTRNRVERSSISFFCQKGLKRLQPNKKVRGRNTMEVVTIDQVGKNRYEHPIFTGPEVLLQELLPESEEFRINIVHFGPGVRNKLHFHSTEQILIVTAGCGIVATEHQETEVRVGDIVRIPAGEKHWHGATEDSAFAHLYVMLKESEITQVETP